jgi:predicted ATPase
MASDSQFAFPPFTLDIASQSLLRGGEKVFLRSKSFTVLSYLVEHPHRPVTRDELMEEVWPKAKVVEAALRVSIQEIRKALGDDPAKPKFVETLGKNGYRFIAPISLKLGQQSDGKSPLPFVGRAIELEQLRTHLKLANSGQRQVVFVTGEPGIGKTTLVDAFTSGLTTNEPIVAARGQCIEQYGAGAAFLPIIDALEQLCRSADGEAAIASLRRLAPSWLIDLPTLISPQERESLMHQCFGVTPERRLREITAFFEQTGQDRMVVLVLEDLHWLDPSTLALISFLARRRETARLMLIGTYREGEVERFNLPLKNIKIELQLHNHCTQLALKLLGQNSVSEYLAARFEIEKVPESLLSTVYRRSEGNPLFMVNVTDYLLGRDAIVRENGSIKLMPLGERESVPKTFRDLIERQVDALPPEDQQLLETASVAGVTFPVSLLARVLDREREAIEQQCRQLAEREQLLNYCGTRKRPNGKTSELYAFNHSLYQNFIYDHIGEAKRRRLHRKIADLLEQVFHQETEQVAVELALHFERAGDYVRATQYLIQAAQTASQQSAYQEAISHSTSGLKLLKLLPDDRQRAEMDLNLQLSLSVSLASTRGYAAAEVSEAYNRANLLCQKVTDESLRMQALIGLFTFYLMGGKPRRALDFGNQMILAAQSIKDRTYLADGHTCTGMALFYLGEYSAAQGHFDQARAAYGLEDRAPKTTDLKFMGGLPKDSTHRI